MKESLMAALGLRGLGSESVTAGPGWPTPLSLWLQQHRPNDLRQPGTVHDRRLTHVPRPHRLPRPSSPGHLTTPRGAGGHVRRAQAEYPRPWDPVKTVLALGAAGSGMDRPGAAAKSGWWTDATAVRSHCGPFEGRGVCAREESRRAALRGRPAVRSRRTRTAARGQSEFDPYGLKAVAVGRLPTFDVLVNDAPDLSLFDRDLRPINP
jgi:hypothetical protein